MNITFHSSFDNKKLIEAAEQYQEIWDKEGRRVVTAIKKVTGQEFEENHINAIVYYGISHSHPLALRASYDMDTKKAPIAIPKQNDLILGNEQVNQKLCFLA